MKKKYFAAACPQRRRVCDSLFQPSHHIHARPKKSSYRNRGGPREAIEAKKGLVEGQTDGAFAAPTFLSLHGLHLRVLEFRNPRNQSPKKCFTGNLAFKN